ncbi:protein FAM184B isoform X2 [Electrophorus electricus]|uniref:protein FAM184B isoform X2 n=1 Tax=Electrophorus electricus TaxID=8005 RepID=UPI0015D05CD1|nr:protein FAM184B isoform X2 [Electrophorus electricus]
MASSSGKISQPPGACNGTAADFSNMEKELYDYQMHTKMCKKIAQLTKVIYSLNTKNEEQEATLHILRRATMETQGTLQSTTSQDEEESASALRTRLLELQATVEEVEERGQRAEVEYVEHVAMLTQEAVDLRRDCQSLKVERDSQRRLLQQVQEDNIRLEEQCQQLSQERDKDQKREEDERKRREEEEEKREREGEELRREVEERKRLEEECEKRLRALRAELKTLQEDRERAEEEWRSEKEEWRSRMQVLEEERREEQEAARKTLQQILNEHMSQWQQKEEENRKSHNAMLQQRLKKVEAELETREQGLNDCTRHISKLQERIEDLEEQLENGRYRVAEAERTAKKAEEELTVAKERLLLQENELQSKSEELLSQSSSQVKVSAEVEELRSQLSRLNIRNKELELQNSGRSNDHARMLKQHADTLSSMRLELQRAHTEEIRRLYQEVEKERGLDRQELEEEKGRLKEQLRKALEEVIRKHASELRQVHTALDSERRTKEQAEEQRRAAEEDRQHLVTEGEELRMQMQLSITEISKLQEVIQSLEKEKEEAQRREEQREREREREQEQEKEKAGPVCGPECERLRGELEHTHHSLEQIQRDFALQKESLQAEISSLKKEREILQQANHSMEERIRLQFEKNFSDHVADVQKEREKEIKDLNHHWQHRLEELQTQLEENRTLSERGTGERGRDSSPGNGEMERMKLEIQKTRDMNRSLRVQLHCTVQEKERLMKKQQLQVVQEEDEDEETVRADTGREGCDWPQREEELLRAENLNHQRVLQALETRASEELQVERQRLHTQHKLQLEKQKAELTQQHTEWVKQVTQRHMQQIEDLQNELRTHTQMVALQQDLKQQNRLQSLERQLDERSSEVQELKRANEELKEQVNALRAERLASTDNKHPGRSSWKEREDEGKTDTTTRNHQTEVQTITSDFASAEIRLQARIVALETELREREEKGRRRVEDLHTISKLQDKLTERDQHIKKLVEDLHQLSQHPPLSRDGTLKPYDPRTRLGSLTPTLKKQTVEDSLSHVSSGLNLNSMEVGSPKVTRSPPVELPMGCGFPGLDQGNRRILMSRTNTPVSSHPEARSPATRNASPPREHPQQLHHNYNQYIRIPSEQRVIETGHDAQDPQRQEWFTKYFSF